MIGVGLFNKNSGSDNLALSYMSGNEGLEKIGNWYVIQTIYFNCKTGLGVDLTTLQTGKYPLNNGK